ncbi:MAG: C26 family cysteine hydrolase domain-containing family, partial [Gemmatimonadetes bacterium]|nr:C26 family cysteine hydrolase domain-containing family [Gemmatimonadota bacterium]
MAASDPLIGITTSIAETADGGWRQNLDGYYVDAVERVGGCPVIVPMTTSRQSLQPLLAQLDGLVITGGPGITDRLEGSLPEELPPTPSRRAQADLWVWEAIRERHRPVLGICYGMQFINARFGGSIYADAQKLLDCAPHSPSRNGGDKVFHEIEVTQGSLLAELASGEQRVNSYHLQAVAEIGEGLRVCARSCDGLVEAIETADGQMLGVQFHPERMGDSWSALFGNLI